MDQFGGMAVADRVEKQLSGNYRDDLHMIGTTLCEMMAEGNDAVRKAICEAGKLPERKEVVSENPR